MPTRKEETAPAREDDLALTLYGYVRELMSTLDQLLYATATPSAGGTKLTTECLGCSRSGAHVTHQCSCVCHEARCTLTTIHTKLQTHQ